jgi:hypothetical protein
VECEWRAYCPEIGELSGDAVNAVDVVLAALGELTEGLEVHCLWGCERAGADGAVRPKRGAAVYASALGSRPGAVEGLLVAFKRAGSRWLWAKAYVTSANPLEYHAGDLARFAACLREIGADPGVVVDALAHFVARALGAL